MSVDDYALARELVTDAGRLAARMLAGGLTATRKTSVSDIVTAADHAAEELIVGRLRAERPDDGIVGEEGTRDDGARTWFVDPVDGTYNFAAGLSPWCAAVALREGADPTPREGADPTPREGADPAQREGADPTQREGADPKPREGADPALRDGLALGAVYEPVTDLLWLGGRDRPTTVNGALVAPLVDRPLALCSVATYLHPTTLTDDAVREPLLRAWSAAATVRMLGSGSVELAAIAGGRLGAYVQTDCLDWDWLPGAALVRAAGGATRVFEMDGHRWHVAGNSLAVDEVVAHLRG